MNNIYNTDVSACFLDAAYKCKPTDLESLLSKIEKEIEKRDYTDNYLLRAKIVVTSKLALYYSK